MGILLKVSSGHMYHRLLMLYLMKLAHPKLLEVLRDLNLQRETGLCYNMQQLLNVGMVFTMFYLQLYHLPLMQDKNYLAMLGRLLSHQMVRLDPVQSGHMHQLKT